MFRTSVKRNSKDPFPPKDNTTSTHDLITRRGMCARKEDRQRFPRIFASKEGVLTIRHVNRQIRRGQARHKLLYQRIVPSPALPRRASPTNRSPSNSKVSRPIHRSQDGDIVRARRSTYLPGLKQASFSRSLFLLRILWTGSKGSSAKVSGGIGSP